MRKGYLAIAAVLAIVMVLLPEIPALADAIWALYGDFYEEHYQECEVVNESYLVNSKEGYVVIYESPVSSEEVAMIKNGKALHIGCTWKDEKGRVWAAANLYGFEPDEEESLAGDISSGWLFMEELSPIYNEGDFMKEHRSSLKEYQGELDQYEIQNGIVTWAYPGSGTQKDIISEYFNEGEVPDYEYLYTDPDGLRWTRINYYYGFKKCWVCVDDPENEDLSVSYGPGVTEQELYPAKTPVKGSSSAVTGHADKERKTAAILVAGVVVITAVLITLIFGKKKGKKK